MTPRVTVVSHASVVAANQSVYSELSHELDIDIVVPSVWRDELRATSYGFTAQPLSAASFHPVAVMAIGRAQRHVHLCSPVRVLQRLRTDILIIEEEAFSVAGWRWSRAARSLDIPYAIQSAENLERRHPLIVRWWERQVLRHSAWVMARSPAAAVRSLRHGAIDDPSRVEVVAHGVDGVSENIPKPRTGVVGYVGRFSEAKGVGELIEVARQLPNISFEFVGDGPLRDEVLRVTPNVRWLGTLSGSELSAFYQSVAVIAVPSRTTPTWSEQFGRVIVEAQAAGTPVVAYDSGEIPWVASETAVRLVPEGDINQLKAEILELALGDSGRELGRVGRERVAQRFTNAYAAQQTRRFIQQHTF